MHVIRSRFTESAAQDSTPPTGDHLVGSYAATPYRLQSNREDHSNHPDFEAIPSQQPSTGKRARLECDDTLPQTKHTRLDHNALGQLATIATRRVGTPSDSTVDNKRHLQSSQGTPAHGSSPDMEGNNHHGQLEGAHQSPLQEPSFPVACDSSFTEAGQQNVVWAINRYAPWNFDEAFNPTYQENAIHAFDPVCQENALYPFNRIHLENTMELFRPTHQEFNP